MVRRYSGNRDSRLVPEQQGGSLQDGTHQSLALWVAACAERVLPLFEQTQPDDNRPRAAIDAARAWAASEISMMEARTFAFAAHDTARDVDGAAREAARAAGHAVATAHMADHELGAAFYALPAVARAHPEEPERVAEERRWQRESRTPDIRELVLDDMHNRADKFKGIFFD